MREQGDERPRAGAGEEAQGGPAAQGHVRLGRGALAAGAARPGLGQVPRLPVLPRHGKPRLRATPTGKRLVCCLRVHACVSAWMRVETAAVGRE